MSTTSQIIKFSLTGIIYFIDPTFKIITEILQINSTVSYITFYPIDTYQCYFYLNVMSSNDNSFLYEIYDFGNYDWNCDNPSKNFSYNYTNNEYNYSKKIQMPYDQNYSFYSSIEDNSGTIEVYANFTEVVCSEETVSNKNKTSLKIIRPLCNCNCNCMYNICPHK